MGGFSGTANSILIVNNDATQVALTGTGANTSETILKTVTLPALGANSTIDIDTLFSWTSSANTKTFRIRLGGIGGAIVASFAVTTNVQQQHKTIVRNVNSTSSQKFFNNSTNAGFGVSGAAVNTSAIDTSAPTTLVFTGQLDAAAAAAGNSINYEASTVQVIL
jgi:hypothetical protein